MVVANEEVLDLVAVAAGGAQADHVPGVDPGGLAGGQQQRADDDLALGVASGRAVGLDDAGMPAQPGGVPAAADERPASGQPVAVALDDRLRLRTRTPGQHGLRIAAPDFLRDRGVEVSGRHGAAVPLAQAPGGAGVVLRHLLDHLEKGRRVGLEAAEGARQQQTEQAFPVQRGLKRGRQAQTALRRPGLGLDGRGDALDPRAMVLAGLRPRGLTALLRLAPTRPGRCPQASVRLAAFRS